MNFIAKLVLTVVLGATMMACGVPLRQITAQHWLNDKTLFVAYAESQDGTLRAVVQRCNLGGDNHINCQKEPEVNHLLNPE